MSPLAAMLLALAAAPDSDDPRAGLPRTLAEEVAVLPEPEPEFPEPEPFPLAFAPARRMEGDDNELSIGPTGGYLWAAHGDKRGNWFFGAQARLHFLRYFALEAAVSFNFDEHESGDVKVTQIPTQASLMFYPFHGREFLPYVLAGAGYYYVKLRYHNTLSAVPDENSGSFGTHAGAGAEFRYGIWASIHIDVRYVMFDPSSDVGKKGDYNYWQIGFGINFFF